MNEYQVIPGASGYWHLYQMTGGSAHYVDKYLTENEALAEAKRRGWAK